MDLSDTKNLCIGEWRPLAEQGDPASQFNLGLMYENGRVSPTTRPRKKWGNYQIRSNYYQGAALKVCFALASFPNKSQVVQPLNSFSC
jgi:TPR repeat protein